ncbi:MAG: zinc-ribbon domain-containing protein [Candidatus Izemoplasmatales bacterium]
MKICSNCGEKATDDAKYCISCGADIENAPIQTNQEITNEKGRTISTLTVVFGGLGFWPLFLIGSLTGIVLYIISKNYEPHRYENRARIGLALSVGSLLLYITALIFLLIVIVSA